jgi:uncharacterized protein YgbK (DUF1537 family)
LNAKKDKMMQLGVVADDVTGANDIGSMFAKQGWLTHVYSFQPEINGFDLVDAERADVVILNTNSRMDSAHDAYKKVYGATLRLKDIGCRQFHNKTCSVFRGNIGPAFDAMLDALGLDFGVVVLGFPKNGRITRNGIHYVHGKKLADSEFRYDPVHPMRESNLVSILQSQTDKVVDLLPYETIGQGPEYLREAINQKRTECQYLILDVINQDSLKIIARAVHDQPVLCGSSALGEELPRYWNEIPKSGQVVFLPYWEDMGVLITSGSLMPQTAAQIEYLENRGKPVLYLSPEKLLDENSRKEYIDLIQSKLIDIINSGVDVVLHTTASPEEVQRIHRQGLASGYSSQELSCLVSDILARITNTVLRSTGQNRLIVAGGETSAAVCDQLGVYSMRVWKEIQPGLPSCLSLNNPNRLMVLKSGSFGNPDFFEKALTHLKINILNAA